MSNVTREEVIELVDTLDTALILLGEDEDSEHRVRARSAIAALQSAVPVQGEVVYRCAFCEHVYIEPVSRCDCLEHGVKQRWERWIITPEFCPPAKAQVPEGWKLVPVEPTDHMSDVGMVSAGIDITENDARHVYSAMLAASPQPAETEEKSRD